MPKVIIDKNYIPKIKASKEDFLMVSEMFCDTIQGEGVSAGQPAFFLRLSGCSLDCKWCDSKEIWKKAIKIGFTELLGLIYNNTSGFEEFKDQRIHLVITGGSPLLQQDRLVNFLSELFEHCGPNLFIELENECTIDPHPSLEYQISLWNNSPKLFNSGIESSKRYKPKTLRKLSTYSSQFKFVIESENDWEEIEDLFIEPACIFRHQIVLMPKGCSREELEKTRLVVAEIAMREKVKYSDRLQIILYDKKTGV